MTRYRWLLLALVLFAAGVRLFRLDWDQYHFYHPDERAVASAVNHLSFSPLQLNPKFFNYGSLPFYVTKTVTSSLDTVRGWFGSRDRWFSGYDGSIITARALSALWGAAAVLLLALLAMRLYDNRRVALLSAFLLAAAVSHVQNSHFATNDIPLTTLILLALYFLVRVAQDGQPRHYLLAGVSIGLALAAKFSAMPILLPLGIAVLVRWRAEGRLARPLLFGFGALVAAVAGFFVAQPYAFLDYREYSRSILEQSHMVRNAGDYPYTNQYIGVPKYLYELQEMVLWGMGPLLGLAAVWGTVLRCGRAVRQRSGADLVLLSWVIPFFLISGSFDVKFPRYLLPTYPLLILWASAWLDDWARRGRAGRVARGAVVAGTALYLLAFMSIYTRPHSIVTASEWVHTHIRDGSTILTQHWDEGFPFSLPGRQAERYKVIDLPYYDADTPEKWQKISRQLSSGDYVALQTKRLYGAVTRAPSKFPISTRYFSLLFEGKLGYTLIKDITSRPGLFGVELPTELADESFSVYDHPKAVIFQNVEHLAPEEIYDRIMGGVPTLTRRDLLLATADNPSELGSGEVEPLIRSSFAATALCLVFLEILGLAAYFLLRPVLTPRIGLYGFSKVFGVLLALYPPWLAASIGWVDFSQGSVLVSALIVALLGVWSYRRHPDMEIPRGEFTATEIFFWGCFTFQLLVRAFNPEIYWGEKPMDFSFLNTLYRATSLPPPEPWFAGSPLHYTYFGTYIVAGIGKGLGIHPALMFNLGIAATAAMTTAAVFAAGAALGRRWSVGAIAAFLATLTGNLDGVREAISRGNLNFDYFWATSRVIEGTINEFPLWSFLFADLHAHMLVMPYTMSFVCAVIFWIQRRDRISSHVPFSSAPLLLLMLGFLLGTIMITNGWSTPTYALLLPFLLGISFLTTHEGEGIVSFVLSAIGRVLLPTVSTVALAYLFYLPFWLYFSPPTRNFGWEHDAFARPYDYFTIHGLFFALVVPFFFVVWRRSLLPTARSVGRSVPAQPSDDIADADTVLVAADAYIAARRAEDDPPYPGDVAIARAENGVPYTAPAGGRLGSWRRAAMVLVFLGLLVSLLNFEAIAALNLPGTLKDWQAESIRVFAAICGVLGLFLAILPQTPMRYRYALGLASFAFFVTGGVDLVHVWDRMNTVFKFYLESWFLFSLPSAIVISELWRGTLGGRLGRAVWRGVIAVLLLITVFTAVTDVHGVLTTQRTPVKRPTLDGMVYLEQHAPHELAAYEWLNRNVKGIPVLLEAQGPSYQDFTRVTMNTGLPTVLGWDYHVTQRAQSDRDIRRRKADITTIYTAKNEPEVAAALQRYHTALVFVGPLERRTYKGANLDKFQEWTSLLTPVYQNPGVTIFAVNGRFAGAVPVTTIEEVASVADTGEEAHDQDPLGRLNQPRGLAIDAAGNVYVADFVNNRIQKFDANLQPLIAWGKRGEVPGEFKDPCGVAVGPDQLVYVADTWNGRVQVFTAEGVYRLEWAAAFYGPRGIAVTSDGTVYVADTGNHRIVRFAPDGTKETQWGSKGDAPSQYFEPTGIAVDEKGLVYVADNGNGRLHITDKNGAFVRAFDVPGWKSQVFSEPYVTLGKDGTIWLTVPVEKEVRAYSPEGKLLATIKGGPGQPFDRPMGIGIQPLNGNLVITDLEHRIVQVPMPATR